MTLNTARVHLRGAVFAFLEASHQPAATLAIVSQAIRDWHDLKDNQ